MRITAGTYGFARFPTDANATGFLLAGSVASAGLKPIGRLSCVIGAVINVVRW
jgi:hypothetical protein